MTDQNKSARVKISGLWISETKNGQKYMSGSNGSQRWTIWPNSFKEKESDPTHILYVEQAKKREEGSSEATPF